jgi:hypothetical protein
MSSRSLTGRWTRAEPSVGRMGNSPSVTIRERARQGQSKSSAASGNVCPVDSRKHSLMTLRPARTRDSRAPFLGWFRRSYHAGPGSGSVKTS